MGLAASLCALQRFPAVLQTPKCRAGLDLDKSFRRVWLELPQSSHRRNLSVDHVRFVLLLFRRSDKVLRKRQVRSVLDVGWRLDWSTVLDNAQVRLCSDRSRVAGNNHLVILQNQRA